MTGFSNIRGTTALVGVLGEPVHHSLSPVMQNAALQTMGLDWAFLALPAPAAELAAVVRGLEAMNCRGLNVTIPHKQAVAELCRELSPPAQRLGAVNTLVPKQRAFFRVVTEAVDAEDNSVVNAHFLQSAGGCGKTYVLILILKYVRSKGLIAIAVASSGIAALLLPGGTTKHSRFGIPLELGVTSSLKMGSDRVKIIQLAKVIIWDEAPMANKDNFRVVDLLLRDIMKKVDPSFEHVPFGGKVIVCSGDWRQILPVVQRGTRGSILNACLKSSPVWPHFIIHRLEENMRVAIGSASAADDLKAAYAGWLL